MLFSELHINEFTLYVKKGGDHIIIVSSLVIFMVSKLNTLDCGDNSCFSKGRKNSLNALFSKLAFQVPQKVFSVSCVFGSDSFHFTVFIFFHPWSLCPFLSLSLSLCFCFFSLPSPILQFVTYLERGQCLIIISSLLQCLRRWLYFIIIHNALGTSPSEN